MISESICSFMPSYMWRLYTDYRDRGLNAKAKDEKKVYSSNPGLSLFDPDFIANKLQQQSIPSPSKNRFVVYECSEDLQVTSLSLNDGKAKKFYQQMQKADRFFQHIANEYILYDVNIPMRVRLNVKKPLSFSHNCDHHVAVQWNTSQKCIDYGYPDLVCFGPFEEFVEIMAHEFMHGYFQNRGTLQYSGQSGALNESCADIIGLMVKHFDEQTKCHESKWLIGDGFLINNEGKKMALRSFKEPGNAFKDHKIWQSDQQVRHMSFYDESSYYAVQDFGGVHIHSGIPNHAFYHVANNLGGFSFEKTGRIWVEAIKNSSFSTDFEGFAKLTSDAAKKHGEGEVQVVNKAWSDVGIGQKYSLPGNYRSRLISVTMAPKTHGSVHMQSIALELNGQSAEKNPFLLKRSLIIQSMKAILNESSK